jgi:hypothetical protein
MAASLRAGHLALVDKGGLRLGDRTPAGQFAHDPAVQLPKVDSRRESSAAGPAFE